MKKLRLKTASGAPLLDLHGEALTWASAADDRLMGFSELHLHAGGTNWILIDTEAGPYDNRNQNEWNLPIRFGELAFPEDYQKHQGRACFKARTGDLLDAGDPRERRLKNGATVHLAVRSRSPLAPDGLEYLLDLRVETDNHGGVVVRSDLSRVWALSERKDKGSNWIETSLAAMLPTPASQPPAQWLTNWSTKQIGVVKLDRPVRSPMTESPGPFLTFPKSSACTFGLSFLSEAIQADGQQVFPLVSHLIWTEDDRAEVDVRALFLDPKVFRPWTVGSVQLRAIRTRLTGSVKPGPWIVEWYGLPGQATDDGPDFVGLYERWTAQYWLGLASTRSRGRLSYVPTQVRAANLQMSPRFSCREISTGKWSQPTLFEIYVGRANSAVNATLELVFGNAIERRGSTADLIVETWVEARGLHEVAIRSLEDPPDLLRLEFKSPAGATNGLPAHCVGGMRIETGALDAGQLALSFSSESLGFGPPPLNVDLALQFAGASFQPVTQDPESGFEALSGWLDRERPVVFAVDATPFPPFDLSIRELANPRQSRELKLGLRLAGPDQKSLTTDVVILDPSPLTIARVKSSAMLQPLELAAEYVDNFDGPPSWQFRSELGLMDVTLPPQVIGEEMIKGRVFLRDAAGNRISEVPRENEPFDFRLSPAAQVQFDRTDIDTARTESPWSLRRLLALRPGVAGVKMTRAEFELLYGMTTTIESSGLRVAELDALVGRIPFADEVRNWFRPSGSGRVDEKNEARKDRLRRLHAGGIAEWIHSLLYRPSHWGVMRDWTQRRPLTIDEDVTFRLRNTRQTANPFQIGTSVQDDLLPGEDFSHAKDGRVDEFHREPLRGGVDWPFQSKSVYAELRRQPQSVGGSVHGLVFGSLGGSGKQTAAFSRGKTLIISDTTSGRLNAVTVIRLGRIAMLWNHARHVIVYERTSRRARRYETAQPKPGQDPLDDSFDWQTGNWDGFGALRKVREYIEITEPRRAYPDFPTVLPLSGPVSQATFESTIIPVKNAWARDIAGGWVMALRGPLKTAENPYFPFPKIFVESARADSKGGGRVAQAILDPEKLLFFTSTRDQDGGESDAWPPWPDVDYPLVAVGKPAALPARSRFPGTTQQPDAASCEFGQERFSVHLGPADEAVNLLHGRALPAMEASLRSVSLARGRPANSPSTSREVRDASSAFAQTSSILKDAFSELSSRIVDAARQAPDATLDAGSSLRSAAQALLVDVAARTGKFGEAMYSAAEPLGRDIFSWEKDQRKRIDAFKANVAAAASGWAEQIKQADAAGDAATVAAAIESVGLQVSQRVTEFGFVPSLALERIEVAIEELAQHAQRVLADARSGLGSTLEAIQRQVEALPLDSVSPALVQLRDEFDHRVAAIRDLSTEVERMFSGSLGELFSRLPVIGKENESPFFKVLPIVRGVADLLANWLARIASEIPIIGADPEPTEDESGNSIAPEPPTLPNWATLREALDLLVQGPGGKTWAAFIAAEIERHLMAALRGQIRAIAEPIEQAIRALQDDVQAEYRAILTKIGLGESYATDLETFLSKIQSPDLVAFTAAVQSAVQTYVTDHPGLAGVFDQARVIQDELADTVESLQDLLKEGTTRLEEIAEQVSASLDLIGARLEATGRQVEHAIRAEVDGRLQDLLDTARESSLELTRALASGPINDMIDCTRDALGYYYDAAASVLDVTRSSALFNDIGEAALNALSIEMPFDRIRDRLLPDLANLDVRRLFPDFGGLKLEHLLPDLVIPLDGEREYGWAQIRHGFDKDRLVAWSDVAIDKEFEDATLFDLPPLRLRILRPHFIASSRMEIAASGSRRQMTRGSIQADWALELSGKPMVTIERATLRYDSAGGFDFDFATENLRLAEELDFVTQALNALFPQEEGLTITPVLPAGVLAELSLPLPDLGAGAFTLTGITLFAQFGLEIRDGFEVKTGLWLSKPDRPFGLAVLFLGGGGWFGVEARYRPPDRFVTRVSVGVSAGAFVALNFGVARGSAGVLFTAGVDFYRDWSSGGGTSAISLGILAWGEFSILGIASASLRLVLRITYSEGSMTGYGRVQVSIKICWCYTLRVNRDVTLPFAGSGNAQSRRAALPVQQPLVADYTTAIAAQTLTSAAIAEAAPVSVTARYAERNRPPFEAAVEASFGNFDL